MNKSGIHIKPENKGRFTQHCKNKGFSGPTDACIEEGLASNVAHVRQMANFARNAKKFKH